MSILPKKIRHAVKVLRGGGRICWVFAAEPVPYGMLYDAETVRKEEGRGEIIKKDKFGMLRDLDLVKKVAALSKVWSWWAWKGESNGD